MAEYTNQLAELTEMEFDAINSLDIYTTYIHDIRKSFTNISLNKSPDPPVDLLFTDSMVRGVNSPWPVEMVEFLHMELDNTSTKKLLIQVDATRSFLQKEAYKNDDIIPDNNNFGTVHSKPSPTLPPEQPTLSLDTEAGHWQDIPRAAQVKQPRRQGNNKHGRSGVKKCLRCRKASRKVLISMFAPL
jgi:hypothetical protein